ncbi:MAG: hypothetical protein H7829_17835 [Magnetococcus sp. THC-1_WYH]
MKLARRVVQSLIGGLEKQMGNLIWKFADKSMERLCDLVEKRLASRTGSGANQPVPALEDFKNNLNTPEYHSPLTLALRDALQQQKDFRDEVERLLGEKTGPKIHLKAKAGDNSHIIQIGGNVQGDIKTGG